jgi:hypothetical protein
MEVMEAVMEELKARSVYLYETYAPYYVCSFMTHAFNQMNQRREIYWDSKRVPNMRLHILFVAPAGFMKSFYMGTMGGERFSIFRNCGVPIGFEQSMCLPAGEKVNMADGSYKNIEDIKCGDQVLGYSGYMYAHTIPSYVTATHIMFNDTIYKITLEDGKSIRLTPNHPLLTTVGWKEARALDYGDEVAVVNDNNIDISRVVDINIQKGEIVYNLSTDSKTFVANNIITHNTEAAFVGTIRDIDGIGHPTLGAAADYKDGMLLIDEFSALTNAMKVQYNSQMDAQLLAALDHGHVVKRLGTGRIEYTTNLTLWAGVQPAKYDLSSGLGRRMCFLLFLPTKLDNIALMRTMHKTRNIKPDVREMDNLWGLIKNSVSNMERIETIDFGDSVLKLYEELNLFSYESSYFDRLLLGWHLATYGPEPHMMIEAQDKELLQLVNREKKWRDEIAAGVDHAQMMKIIKACGSYIDGKIQISKPDLIQECTMVGWNARQVADVLTELTRFGMIENHGSRVVVLE